MKIVVVGAGISGCVSALASAEAGHTVTLLEAGRTPGGVLRDHELRQGRWFRNCQYLNVGTPWCDMLLTLTGMEHEVFDHHYGSWNDLFGSVIVHNDFAQVVVPGTDAVPIRGEPAFASAADRLSRYEEPVGTALSRWGARWGELESLDHENCQMMQIGRVFHVDDLDGVVALKHHYAACDSLYGVPRGLMQPPASLQQAALPTGGWNHAFRVITQALEARGVNMHLQAPAKASVKDGTIRVESLGDAFDADLVVWCANPRPLVKALGLERLDSPATHMSNALFEVEGLPPRWPIYWQVFSQTSSIVRLFSYHLEGRSRMTVEAFAAGADANQIAIQATEIAADFGLRVSLKVVGLFPDRRYVLVTTKDRERFDRVDSAALESGVITGGWHAYGRDQRMAHILGAMEQMGAL